MSGDKGCYGEPLPESDAERRHFLDKHEEFVPLAVHNNQRKWFQRVIIIQWIVMVIFSLILITVPMSLRNRKNYWIPNEIYSPVQDLIRYKTRVFDSGFGNHTTKYMGRPTKQNRQSWEDLYQAGISKIPLEQAAKLPVKTAPIPEAPGYYVVGIDVFHQLHCLNQLRLKVWGVDEPHGSHGARDTVGVEEEEEEEEDGLQDIGHLDHCIDSLRQSLMCSSDISTIIWQWDTNTGTSRPHANVTHTCRDFDVIHQWALENQAPKWNQSIYVPDPLQE
ncbi:hypothetical protein P168DRAFT_319831 [Aspergillus campestris IBT 28561]|uniref:Tat pathway signal sequence n=1 Tax=Aspergillus campestris (strain IBT 28561) TaxID=1392248 RepID=A0A2I1D0A4_ASPC2|nr:uncharacterized protein P168DRAFT_319831 [Aspergillus campestris IBT 28561]PKY03303.1 hypothetical protein P168DRAFT_319831 [Aspergillus campestris IBT 28561]